MAWKGDKGGVSMFGILDAQNGPVFGIEPWLVPWNQFNFTDKNVANK